ncbi:MAG: DUF885 domain-containing protein [Xanthomonadales bacterium]|nr:DUF885 domain-containing protein [Xanthomonadales bacterium]
MLRTLPVALLTLALAACGPSEQSAPSASASSDQASAKGTTSVAADLNQLYADYWEASLELNPLRATSVGDARYNDRMPNTLSEAHRQKVQAFRQQWLDRISAIDASALDGQDRLSYEIFRRDLQNELDGDRFPGWMQPVNQFRNIVSMAAQLGGGKGAQPFKTVTDYDNWLKRASGFPAIFDTAIANMRQGMEAGVVQPRVLMEKTLPQFDALIKADPEQSIFWGPIRDMPDDFPEADRERLQLAFRALIAEQLSPAMQRLRDFVADEYLPASRDSVSLAALPDGEAWYAYNVRESTSTDLSPAQIHQIGLDEVARIHAEMQAVMDQVGFEGDLQAFFQFLSTDPQFSFESEQALLDAYNGLRETVQAGVPALFSLLPKADFEIRPVEAYRAASSSGGSYQRPSQDRSRPGVFYVNTYDLPSRKIWAMESLFLHEAIPGHHFQLALQQELDDLPMFRRFGREIAFSEGWGLYAESLGQELGVYTDPYQYFGRLQAELWRAIRLVVDTGLHSKGWTREQVIDYMRSNSAASQTQAVSEAERYIAIPAQALAYKIGEMKIRQLRQRAEAALGEAFDIRAFHAEVLRDGSIPLDVLEGKIDRWIAAQQKP